MFNSAKNSQQTCEQKKNIIKKLFQFQMLFMIGTFLKKIYHLEKTGRIDNVKLRQEIGTIKSIFEQRQSYASQSLARKCKTKKKKLASIKCKTKKLARISRNSATYRIRTHRAKI